MKSREDYWPRGLYRYTDGRGFKYRLPFKIDGKYKTEHIGKVSLKDAIAQADQLNKQFQELALARKNEKVLKRLQEEKLAGKFDHSVQELINLFIREFLFVVNKNEGTRTNKIYHAEAIADFFGKKKLISLEVKEWCSFIEKTVDSYHVYTKYKTEISQFYSFCQGKGFLPANHPNYGKLIDIPSLRITPDKKRHKMSIEQFQLLYNHAEEAIQDILKVAIITGLRLTDILTLQVGNIHDGYLYVVPRKTADLPNPRKLRFKINEDLKDCGICIPPKSRVNPSRPDKIVEPECPYLFNYVYDRDNKSDNKSHPNQILKRHFSRRLEFAVKNIVNEKWARYKNEELKEQKPTFHEVRALYADLCQAIFDLPEQEVSKRLGHRDRTESLTTKKYLSGTWYEINDHIPFTQIMSMTDRELDRLLGKDFTLQTA